MLKIEIPETEVFDELTGKFTTLKKQVLQLEHSLVSISKWESKWHKPFLRKEPMTNEETIDYIRCMTITQNVDPMVYLCLSYELIEKVNSYIADSMSATYFKEDKKSVREVITSERIYYWMIALQIPFECQKWHLNRLLTLIRVCNIENSPKKKMSPNSILKQNGELNAARRKAMKSKG